MGRFDTDPGQTTRLGDGRDDRDRPVGADCQDAVQLEALRRLEHRSDVREVDHLRNVGFGETRGLGVPVDRCHPEPELLGAQDRAPLMAAGADEENGLHGRDSTVARLRR